MEIGHTPNHAPFLASLHNSAIAFTATGNTVAAVATRRLEIEVYVRLSLPAPSEVHIPASGHRRSGVRVTVIQSPCHYGCGFIMRKEGPV